MTLDLLIIFGLILLNGFFAMSEMAVVTSRKSRLRQMAQHHRGARLALALAERPENFLSAVQIGITLVGVLTGAIGGVAIADDVALWIAAIPALTRHAPTIALALSVGVITFATLIWGELVPKRLALLNPERIASLVAPPLALLAVATRPVVALLSFSTRLTLRLLGVRDRTAQTITEEEIRMMVAEGAEQGVIDDHERNMVNRVLRLGDRSIDSLMTPRNRIVWLDAEAGIEANLATMRGAVHSRFPVRRGSDREVLGILEVKTLVDHLGETGRDPLRHVRPALYLPESTLALRALEEFRRADATGALVVDEYGEIQGLVTTNDILAAVVGNVAPAAGARPVLDAPIVRREDGSWLVDGRVSSDDLRELLGVGELPGEVEHEFHSAAGLMIARFGRIPAAGEFFQWNRWRFEVVDLDGARIDRLLVTALPAAGDQGDPPGHD
jgi:putative hemolysin